MAERDTFLLFVRPLNQAGFRYVVTGSIAAILYGEPRLTYDIDFVVFQNEQNIRQINELFPESDFYVRDIRSMLAMSGDEIDRSELNDWIQRRGLQDVWIKVQA